MKDLLCGEFQNTVADLTIRHNSILDIMSKLSESSARVNRAVVKSVTDCGCNQIEACKIQFPEDMTSIEDLKLHLDNHLRGQLCSSCESILFEELGKMLFYVTALCNCMNINLYDVFLKEYKAASALGVYNMR